MSKKSLPLAGIDVDVFPQVLARGSGLLSAKQMAHRDVIKRSGQILKQMKMEKPDKKISAEDRKKAYVMAKGDLPKEYAVVKKTRGRPKMMKGMAMEENTIPRPPEYAPADNSANPYQPINEGNPLATGRIAPADDPQFPYVRNDLYIGNGMGKESLADLIKKLKKIKTM